MAENDQNLDSDVSSAINKHVREVSARGLAGNVKVLSRRALKDIVDNLIKAYGGLQHEDLISKIAEYELAATQNEQRMTAMKGKLELLQKQNAELQAKDDQLLASQAVDASKIPMLEEQNATLKKTLEGLEAEKENLTRKLDELKASMGDEVQQKLNQIDSLEAELAELKPRFAEMEAQNAAFNDQMADKDAQVHAIQDEMDQARSKLNMEIGERDEQIARLQKALDTSDAKKRIAQLETEVKELKKTINILEIGLEYVDVELDIRPDELMDLVNKVRAEAAGLPAALATRLDAIQVTLEKDAATYPPLLEAMYSNKGDIQVACELAKIFSRQKEIQEHINTISQAGG